MVEKSEFVHACARVHISSCVIWTSADRYSELVTRARAPALLPGLTKGGVAQGEVSGLVDLPQLAT